MPATLELTMPMKPTLGSVATATIELHAFMFLSDLFKERHWSNPCRFEVDHETTGPELLAHLEIPAAQVGAIFVNHRLFNPAAATINPGDRVALVSPGAPMPF